MAKIENDSCRTIRKKWENASEKFETKWKKNEINKENIFDLVLKRKKIPLKKLKQKNFGCCKKRNKFVQNMYLNVTCVIQLKKWSNLTL